MEKQFIFRMTNSLVLVTKGIYENWEGSWEENPVKSVSQQQIDVSVSEFRYFEIKIEQKNNVMVGYGLFFTGKGLNGYAI